MARSTINKKVRFEVFKSDGFACTYCGRTPPTVTLEIDHITPVSAGGTNHRDNLITACFDCNRGKGATSLDAIPESLAQRTVVLKEREAQLRGYKSILASKELRLDREVSSVLDIYESRALYAPPADAHRSIRRFVEELMVFEVIDAMDLALTRMNGGAATWKYFCGICWQKIRGVA